MRFSRFAVLVLIVALLTLYIPPSANPKIELGYQSVLNNRTLAYNSSAPIVINGGGDFANQAIANSWKGNGTEFDPYVISGLNITSSSDSINLVSISNTAVYFCFEDSLLVGGLRGIYFNNVTHGSVVNNTIHSSFAQGISASLSDRINISNNTIHSISSGGHGVYWVNVSYGIIANNSISECGDRGLLLDYSTDCSLVDNVIHSNGGDGIGLRNCESNMIQHNTIFDNTGNGVIFGGSGTSNITDNRIHRNGLRGINLEASQYCIIENNLISSNDYEGILLVGNDFEIRNNTLYDNGEWGMRVLGGVTKVVARWNNFIENQRAPLGDISEESIYDSNYWSDWTWPDNNSDGIVDVPYDYRGQYDSARAGECYDYHPRVTPYLDFRLHVLTRPLIVYPDGSPIYDQTEVNVAWGAAGDTFGHDVRYSIFSSVTGDDWEELAFGLSGTSFLWDISDAPHSENYIIMVKASCIDGLESVSITDSAFAISTKSQDNTWDIGMVIGVNAGVFALIVIAVTYMKRRRK